MDILRLLGAGGVGAGMALAAIAALFWGGVILAVIVVFLTAVA